MVTVFILFVLVQEVLLVLVYTKCFIVSALQERGWLLLILTLKDIVCCGCMSVCVYVREREERGEGEREKRERGGGGREKRERGRRERRERGRRERRAEKREREERERVKKVWEGNR